MSVRQTMVDDARRTAQHREARRTVRRVKGYWYRAGVPWSVRRRRAEELHTHLVAAVEEGRRVRDVVGDDVAAFAAEWAAAERRRPVIEAALYIVGVLTGAPGLLALVGPLMPGQHRTGFTLEAATFLGALLLFLIALMLLRWQRGRLTTRGAAAIGIAIVVGYAVVLGVGQAWARANPAFLELTPTAAWALVAVGTAAAAASAWVRRADRR